MFICIKTLCGRGARASTAQVYSLSYIDYLRVCYTNNWRLHIIRVKNNICMCRFHNNIYYFLQIYGVPANSPRKTQKKSSTLFHFPSQGFRRISPILFRRGLLHGGSRQRGVRCPGRRSRGLSRGVHRCRPEHLPCRPSRAAGLHAVRRRQCRRG